MIVKPIRSKMCFYFGLIDRHRFRDFAKRQFEVFLNPFATLDWDGAGQLMALCVKKARSVNPDLECGICGEHAGDPKSISLCHEIGLNRSCVAPDQGRHRGV